MNQSTIFQDFQNQAWPQQRYQSKIIELLRYKNQCQKYHKSPQQNEKTRREHDAYITKLIQKIQNQQLEGSRKDNKYLELMQDYEQLYQNYQKIDKENALLKQKLKDILNQSILSQQVLHQVNPPANIANAINNNRQQAVRIRQQINHLEHLHLGQSNSIRFQQILNTSTIQLLPHEHNNQVLQLNSQNNQMIQQQNEGHYRMEYAHDELYLSNQTQDLNLIGVNNISSFSRSFINQPEINHNNQLKIKNKNIFSINRTLLGGQIKEVQSNSPKNFDSKQQQINEYTQQIGELEKQQIQDDLEIFIDKKQEERLKQISKITNLTVFPFFNQYSDLHFKFDTVEMSLKQIYTQQLQEQWFFQHGGYYKDLVNIVFAEVNKQVSRFLKRLSNNSIDLTHTHKLVIDRKINMKNKKILFNRALLSVQEITIHNDAQFEDQELFAYIQPSKFKNGKIKKLIFFTNRLTMEMVTIILESLLDYVENFIFNSLDVEKQVLQFFSNISNLRFVLSLSLKTFKINRISQNKFYNIFVYKNFKYQRLPNASQVSRSYSNLRLTQKYDFFEKLIKEGIMQLQDDQAFQSLSKLTALSFCEQPCPIKTRFLRKILNNPWKQIQIINLQIQMTVKKLQLLIKYHLNYPNLRELRIRISVDQVKRTRQMSVLNLLKKYLKRFKYLLSITIGIIDYDGCQASKVSQQNNSIISKQQNIERKNTVLPVLKKWRQKISSQDSKIKIKI